LRATSKSSKISFQGTSIKDVWFLAIFGDTSYLRTYKTSYGVNRSSWSKLFLLQNFMNIDGMTLILFISSPPFSAGPQK
jgi:hypothetical protein